MNFNTNTEFHWLSGNEDEDDLILLTEATEEVKRRESFGKPFTFHIDAKFIIYYFFCF